VAPQAAAPAARLEKDLSSCLAKWLSAQTVLSQACLGLGLVLLAVSVLKSLVIAGVFSFRLTEIQRNFSGGPPELSACE
jgi:hypothetical protein